MDVPQQLPLTRRQLLRRGLFGGALLLLGGGGLLALRPGRSATLPKEGLKVLDHREYALVQAVADRMIPQLPELPRPEVDVGARVDGIIAGLSPSAQRELKQLFGLFDNALFGFLFGGQTRPFTLLEPADQDEVLGQWRDSRLAVRRTGFAALRGLVMGAFYSAPAAWPLVGYPGPPEGFR
jgi:hypothetical protein